MVDPQPDDARSKDEADDRLDDLVAAALEALAAGGAAALERFLAGHALAAGPIRRRLESLRERGLLDPPEKLAAAMPERIGGFRLIRELGSGGMGVVYLAEQEALHRRVALKLLQPGHLYFKHARERFQREIETVASLSHPGIVPIYEIGEDQGLPWFAMEYVEGASLAELLRHFQGADPRKLTGADLRAAIRGFMAPDAEEPPRDEITAQRVFSGRFIDASLRLIEQVAEALAHAHARGVLHRDIKPSNVMVSLDGRAQLVDFGLALLEGSQKLTRSGTQVGSLPYMAPEQLRSDGKVDARTDVYSLGVALYELLTLRSAFEGASAEETRRRVLAADVRSPRSLHRGIDRDVETVCLAAMAPEPGRRIVSAADLARDLAAAREGRPIASQRASLGRRTWRVARSRPVETLAVVAIVALLLATFLFHRDRSITRQLEQFESGRDEESALKRVLDACANGRQPDPGDLAIVVAVLESPERVAALDLLKNAPADARHWDELRQLLPVAGANAAPQLLPLSPLAAITDPRPEFRFDVPLAEVTPHDYVISLLRDGVLDREFDFHRVPFEEGPLEIAFDGAPLELGADYSWSIRDESQALTVDSAVAHFTLLDAAETQRRLDSVATGDPIVDRLMRASLLVHLRLAQRALEELAVFPADAGPADHLQRLMLEARAHVLLADADAFAVKRAELESAPPKQ